MSKSNYYDISTMGKIITLLLMLSFNGAVGQILTGPQAINSYTVAQKRLLVTTTAQFINSQTQSNLDQDSVMNMACEITGMPFLLPYNEIFLGNHVSFVSELLNSGHLKEAKRALENTAPEMRLQENLEIFLCYLHRNGKRAADLDSAATYLAPVLRLSEKAQFANWRNECLMQLAELKYQQGNMDSCKLLFEQLAAKDEKEGEAEIIANAFMRMGDLLSSTDSAKQIYYTRALEIFQVLHLKDKQIQVLWKIASSHERNNFLLAEKELRQIIDLSSQIGFKHNLFANLRLSFVLNNTGNFLDAMKYAQVALKNLEWSGLMTMQGPFLVRIGACLACLGKINESVPWFKRAISSGTRANHLFWYKSVLMLSGLYFYELNKPAMAISLIDSITRLFPPITLWEKLEILISLGGSYEFLGKSKSADKYFRQLLQIANSNAGVDPLGEMSPDYMVIAGFYVSRPDLPMAKAFLKLGLVNERKDVGSASLKYSLYYKIDSLEGNYKSALQNHIKYKLYFDSSISISQRKALDELEIKFATEKKDKDIRLLKQQRVVQQTEIKKNKLVRDIMIAGTVMLLVIVGLLFNRYKLKQRANSVINRKNVDLQRVVNEKEWLLKEVHHRVKNNLHTIISLLESQAAYLENDALKAIENSQHRIYAMSLIHQKLYQAENVKTIDMAVYLPEFIRYLDESFEIHYRIQFMLDIEVINLGVSQAIPLALIINEAVTNSIKYAFPNNSKGQIKIAMHRKANQVTLVFADNGIGIEESLLNMPSETLGLKLMKGLSGDINASFALEIDNGTKITLVFDVDSFALNDALPDLINHKPQYV